MQKITTHLWFDTQAREAGEFYTSVFAGSRVKSVNTLHNTPSGDVDVVAIDLAGHEFTLISAGPLFKFNPSISFLVSCATAEEVDDLWGALSDGGAALMELGAYPFSERYGWLQDRYGLSWQIMLGAGAQKITPVLMFTGKQAGNAEAAIRFYASVFHDSKVGDMMRYGAGEGPDTEGTVKFARFELEGQGFAAMDSAHPHGFSFNEAISLMVNCETQEEIDYYWERLSADPRSEQCGWLKDKFGVSWQVTSTEMETMFAHGTPQQIARVTETFLKMKKFDLAKLRAAYAG
ncbi:MAG TPA: VOC family protein [Thermoanaerobaculia bacterium]|jgi:predicted 3-demethylubiquinone-9 3-methyltransferase (glyoxalase superfamily)